MKNIFAAVLAVFLMASSALAQNPGTVTNHAFAIGAGAGSQGMTSLLCGSAQLAVGQSAADPICKTITGDVTLSAAGAVTLATVNANVGSFGSTTQCVAVTVNAKGLITAISAATCAPAVGSITGLGTGVATALAIATGTNAGSFIVYNGPAGTPSAISLAGGTNCAISSCVSGLGTGVATWAGTPSSANLRAALTDESGTGAAYFQGGDLGTPSAGVLTNATGTASGLTAGHVTTNANLTGPVTSVGNATSLALGQLTNSLGSNVSLNNTANYFDGPSVAQGSTGTWYASGGVVVGDTGSSASILCKLWDGTTVIDSRMVNTPSASNTQGMFLSGFLASPAGNIRISCRDTTSTNGLILFNGTGNSKDATVTAFRIQ